MLSKRKAQKNIEEKASGIEIEENEIDVILDEILEDVEMCRELSNTQSEAKRLADLDEKERAEEIRNTAMETYGETKKRKNEGDDDLTSPRQKRRSGTETLRFLTERNELAKEQHIEEMKVRNEELLIKKTRSGRIPKTQQILCYKICKCKCSYNSSKRISSFRCNNNKCNNKRNCLPL